MNKPLCSIIIPVYNGEFFLERTIQSCLKQTYKFIEIITIDDASTDSSAEIIKKYSQLVYLCNESNCGLTKSLNLASTSAKGDFLLFLGHDDMLQPDHVEKMLCEFEDNTAFVHCNSDIIDENDNVFSVGCDDNKQVYRTRHINLYLTLGPCIHSTGLMIRKSKFDLINGWEEKYRNYGEWLLWIKLAKAGEVRYCTTVRALYRRHRTNITNQIYSKDGFRKYLRYKNECRKFGYSLLKCKLNIIEKVLSKSVYVLINLKYLLKSIVMYVDLTKC